MSEHVFPVRAGMPSHMVVKLGWNAYSRSYFMAYLGEGSDDPGLWSGGLMHVSQDAAHVCTLARTYTAAIPRDFVTRLEADRRVEEEDWMTEPQSLAPAVVQSPHPGAARPRRAVHSVPVSIRQRLGRLLPVLLGR